MSECINIAMIGTYSEKPRSGPSVHIHNLIQSLSNKENIRLYVISKGNKNEVINNTNYEVHFLPFRGPFFLNEVIFSFLLIRKISKLNPDIIHFQGISPYILFFNKKSIIVTVHGLFLLEARMRFRGLNFILNGYPRIIMEKMILLNRNIKYIAVSNYIQRVLKNFTKSTVMVIPNGVDDDFFNLKHQELNNRILYVGNIEERKNLLLILKSLRIVKSIIFDVKLIVIGKIIDEKYYRDMINYINVNNLQKHIIFLSNIEKNLLIKEYQKSSIFVLPSLDEPFGIVLLEAMASGKPIIATRVGGIPSIIKNNENGYLISNDEKELSEKIIFLLSHHKKRKEMGQKGRNLARNYSWNAISQKTINFYSHTL